MKRARTYLFGIIGLCLLVACGQGAEQGAPEQTLGHEALQLSSPPSAPTQVNTFAVLSSGHATLGDRTVLTGGHLGVSTGTGDSVTEGSAAHIAIGSSTLGQRIVLKDQAHAGDLFTGSLAPGAGATYTSLSPYAAPPAQPPIVAFTAGSTTLTVTSPMTVGAGNYGQVTVNSTLTLSGGTYQFQSLTFATNAVLQASTASIVRVAGKVSGTTANFVHIGPTGTQPAGNFRLIVAGATDTNGGISLGTDARVTALVVSRASFAAADRFVGKGALAAKNVTLGNDSNITFQTGFECNADTACDDGNPCTTDACIDAKCTHTALPNGSACPDDGNVCTSDACSSGVCAHPSLPNGTACTSDLNECTSDVCTTGTCTHPAVADGTACASDLKPCTTDACKAGACGHDSITATLPTVTLDKTDICPGEPVFVQASAGTADCSGTISIDNQPGSSRYLTFDGRPGERIIDVTAAYSNGDAPTIEAQVNVKTCSGQAFPNLAFSANPFHEGVVDVRVLNPADFAAGALYTWNFGDGVSAANEVPYIAHDFGSALARDLDVSSFKVSVTVTPPGGTGTTAIRTATIPNLYAVNKHLGRLYVPVTQSRNLVSDGSILNGSYTLTNLEDEAITFNAQYFEFQYCDTNTNAVFTPLHAVSMPLAAHEVQPRTLPIDPSSIPAGVCRISLYFTGASASGVSAVASARFEVVKPTQLQIADSDWLAVYKQIIAGNLLGDPIHFTEEDLARLSYQGKITLPTHAVATTTHALDEPVTTAVEGRGCTPGSVAPPGIQSLTCQASIDENGEPEYYLSDPYIENALKGDAVLSPGCGIVGKLLHALHPAQLYSHDGIMIDNNVHLRDSTALEARMFDAIQNDITSHLPELQPFHPASVANLLKFGWPGAITQDIKQAYRDGEDLFVTPDGKTEHLPPPFNKDPGECPGDAPTWPRVLKAPRGTGDAGQVPLRAAADAALTIDSHYRFAAYSTADIVAENLPGPEAGWAQGLPGTECASFVWMAFQKGTPGTSLLGSFTDDQYAARGFFNPSIDGLFGYTASERLAAGFALYGTIRDKVMEKASSILPPAVPDSLAGPASRSVANTLVNCFASDHCDTDSEDWRTTTTTGETVSPDNLLLWDVYGYNEVLRYRERESTLIYRWAASIGSGSLTGHVELADGTPVADADLIFGAPDGTGGTVSTSSAADGSFKFDAVSAGAYVLTASKLIDGFDNTGHLDNVTITAGDNRDVVIKIQFNASFRSVRITGQLDYLQDFDFGSPTPAEHIDVPFDYTIPLDLSNPTSSRTFVDCVDDVMVRISFSVSLDTTDHETVHLKVSSAGGSFGDTCGSDFESDSKLSDSFDTIDLPALDTPVPPGSFDPFFSPKIADGDDYAYEFTPWNNPETFPP